MCGILIKIGESSKAISMDQLLHRGPDSCSIWKDGHVQLGHSRLSIQDTSTSANQPMVSKCGDFVIVFNGEIYNHWEIREELIKTGIRFSTTSDTETILLGWIKWGDKILSKLNGIFAFGIYDRLNKSLVVVRDQLGVKPLYISESRFSIQFSSELKAIKSPDNTISPKALVDYLTFLWSPGEKTPFVGIEKVLPGTIYKIDVETLVVEKRMLPLNNFNASPIPETEEEWTHLLDHTLEKIVKRQLISDVPVGFFLSGGLDSSLLVAYAKKLYPNIDFPCFTVRVNDKNYEEGFASDLPFATMVADHLKLPLHIIDINIDWLNELDKMVWTLDEPQGDIAPILVGHISRVAREQYGIKVLLGGTGGDDVFSGYRRHLAIKYDHLFDLIPNSIRRAIKDLLNKIPDHSPTIRRLKKLAKTSSLEKEQRMLSYFSWLPDEIEVQSILAPEFLEMVSNYDPNSYAKSVLSSLPQELSDLDKMLVLEQKTFLVDHNLNYTDKMSMAYGVEVRVPYLDHELISLSNALPPRLKIKNGTTKYILRKVAESYLPNEVIYRPKTGFGGPLREWMRGEYADRVRDRISADSFYACGLFNKETVLSILRANQSGKHDYSYTILTILCIESWYRQFVQAKA